ncbi:hypothetical protein [Bacillus sp. 1P06AnD]|uniref:hypothetical protein n=1 Tax=Bacillus sp. 1P06AnD TaxID=3132208 RepID=UPI0039A27F83
MDYSYVDLEKNMTFTDDQLHYFRHKLDENSIRCLRLVAEATGPYGLLRTKMPDFKENRRIYDMGFNTLESQGFIRSEGFGNMRPYFITVRGEQLLKLLANEEK